ncbi:MAG: cytochrome P450, partial [Phenylobacterium sp.]
LRDQAVESAKRLVASLYDRGQMDVLADFAYPFTVEMISRKLGVPIEDGPKLIDWTAAKLARSVDAHTVRRAKDAVVEMSAYFQSYAHPRDDRPSDGLIRALALVEADGDQLSEVELTAVCWELVSAGFETTANMIANALVTLLQHPDQLELLRADPGLMRGAVEECLRFEPPLAIGRPFRAVTDLELAGRKIAAGDRVRVWLAAANRDPEIFPDPNRFDISRSNTRQLAFSYGSHVCLGNSLARMELAVALEALLKLPDLVLADPAPRWLKHALRIQDSLPVKWDGSRGSRQ